MIFRQLIDPTWNIFVMKFYQICVRNDTMTALLALVDIVSSLSACSKSTLTRSETDLEGRMRAP